jgi:hypothetical protein
LRRRYCLRPPAEILRGPHKAGTNSLHRIDGGLRGRIRSQSLIGAFRSSQFAYRRVCACGFLPPAGISDAGSYGAATGTLVSQLAGQILAVDAVRANSQRAVRFFMQHSYGVRGQRTGVRLETWSDSGNESVAGAKAECIRPAVPHGPRVCGEPEQPVGIQTRFSESRFDLAASHPPADDPRRLGLRSRFQFSGQWRLRSRCKAVARPANHRSLA